MNNNLSNIEKMEFAIQQTIKTHYSSYEGSITKIIKDLLVMALVEENYNYRHFTSKEGARKLMISVGKDGIIEELIKHIVKLTGYKTISNQAQLLGVKRSLNDIDITEDEIVLKLYLLIRENNINDVEYILNNYQRILVNVVNSFVRERYQNRHKEDLDNLNQLGELDQNLINKIENNFQVKKDIQDQPSRTR